MWRPLCTAIFGAQISQINERVTRLFDDGRPTPLALVPTTKGAPSVVVGPSGCAYIIDPLGGRILKVEPK